jgi:hypothetical protein
MIGVYACRAAGCKKMHNPLCLKLLIMVSFYNGIYRYATVSMDFQTG